MHAKPPMDTPATKTGTQPRAPSIPVAGIAQGTTAVKCPASSAQVRHVPLPQSLPNLVCPRPKSTRCCIRNHCPVTLLTSAAMPVHAPVHRHQACGCSPAASARQATTAVPSPFSPWFASVERGGGYQAAGLPLCDFDWPRLVRLRPYFPCPPRSVEGRDGARVMTATRWCAGSAARQVPRGSHR